MKKSSLIISILLFIAIVTLILIVIFKPKEDNWIDYTTSIDFTSKNQLLAIAKLNNIEEVSNKYISNFENIKVYQTDGEEQYLIIPRYNNVEVSIYEIGENEKENLITTTDMPFVITTNSNNIVFKVVYNKEKFKYIPSISEDNKLNYNKHILDITTE